MTFPTPGYSGKAASARNRKSLLQSRPLSSVFGRLDAVVANAGVTAPWVSTQEIKLEEWRRVFAVNVEGALITIKFAAQQMMASGGSIVALGSLNSWQGHPQQAAYVASKHAVLGLVRSVALDLGRQGIRVNALAPGPIATDALLGRIKDRSGGGGQEFDQALRELGWCNGPWAYRKRSGCGGCLPVPAQRPIERDNGPAHTRRCRTALRSIALQRRNSFMKPLEGKTILVTGASKGIGAATTVALGRAGASVIAHYGGDRDGALKSLSALDGDQGIAIGAELADMAAVDELWRAALAWRGRIDVVVNNAAVMRLHGGIGDTVEAWDDVWTEAVNVNILAPSRLMRHAVNHYLERGGGVLVTISSWAAQRGITNPGRHRILRDQVCRDGCHEDDCPWICQEEHPGLHGGTWCCSHKAVRGECSDSWRRGRCNIRACHG